MSTFYPGNTPVGGAQMWQIFFIWAGIKKIMMGNVKKTPSFRVGAGEA